tara:strand:- start:33 stop:662 length:630 start_codon:yes stop_codon:yes gene_type:complete
MNPRIYTYKITFEEVPYYYYGVKKEKIYNEEYWGSPKTNKWCWEFYTPNKQILELFDYTEDGYIKSQEVEKRLIKPVLNNKFCLNENVGGIFSLTSCSKAGKIGGKKTTDIQRKNKTGFYSICEEERKKNGRKGGLIIGPKTGADNVKLKRGYCGRSKDQMSIDAKKGCSITNFQRWECLVTGFVANPGNLTRYQKKRNIDIKLRKKLN